MPTRRMFLQDEGVIDEGGQGGGFGASSLFGGIGEVEGADELDPGVQMPRYPDDAFDNSVMGSRDTAREFGGGRATPTTPVPGEQQFQIPQGVTVSPTGNASFTPSAPLAPAPVSAQPGNPMSTGGASSMAPSTAPGAPMTSAEGPRRVSPLISSALFPETRGGQMLGAAGGLMDGGLRAPGGSQRGGTSSPTEQMLALLRTLSQGA